METLMHKLFTEGTRGEPKKQTEIGPVPESWTVARLDQLATIERGKFSHRPRNAPQFYGGSIPFVQTGDVSKCGGRIRRYSQTLNERGLAISRMFPRGTILLTIAANIGFTGILDFDSACTDSLVAITPTGGDSAEFLNYYLQTQQPIMDRLAPQGTQKNINIQFLKPWLIPLPPHEEQVAIAAVLSAAQQAIERQERLIALTTELKKALMHKLFTEGTRGEPKKQTEIGPVPKSWDVVPLGSLAKIGNGATPKRDNVAYWTGGSIPWLTSGKIHEGHIKKPDQYVTEIAKAECHLPLVSAGSLLIAITGEGKTLGNAALVEFDTCVSQHLAYLRFHCTDVVAPFLLYFLQGQYAHLRQMSVGAGSTKKALTCGLLKRYLVPVPKKDEQKLIAAVLETIVAKLNGHERTAECLNALFRTLLHELMTAKIRVHDLALSALEEAQSAGAV
jgi:type I restriction enzyme S subunit